MENVVSEGSKRYKGIKNYVNIEKSRADKAETSLTKKVEQHNTEIKRAVSLVVDPQMRRWTFVLPIICLTCIVILSIYLSCAIWVDAFPKEYNILDYIDNTEGIRNDIMSYILLGILGLYSSFGFLIYKRWLSKKHREAHRCQLEQEYYAKIRSSH